MLKLKGWDCWEFLATDYVELSADCIYEIYSKLHDLDKESKEATNASAINLPFTNICSLCGAWKGAYGLEPTPELYISHTIEILREIRRVLRKDGVVFWNIGDSYWGGGQGGNTWGGTKEIIGTEMDGCFH